MMYPVHHMMFLAHHMMDPPIHQGTSYDGFVLYPLLPIFCLLDHDIIFSSPKNRPCTLEYKSSLRDKERLSDR